MPGEPWRRSGTDALELALRAVGVGAGDEVVVPANSFIALAGAVARIGANPVFVDCDPRYLLIDPDAIAAAIPPDPGHHAGPPLRPAGAHGDGCRGGGRRWRGGSRGRRPGPWGHPARPATGSWGLAAATSFYPGKNLGAYGDGGAVTTNCRGGRCALWRLRNHGGVARYQHPVLGFNSRLDSLQAVVLAAKLHGSTSGTRPDGRRPSAIGAADRRGRGPTSRNGRGQRGTCGISSSCGCRTAIVVLAGLQARGRAGRRSTTPALSISREPLRVPVPAGRFPGRRADSRGDPVAADAPTPDRPSSRSASVLADAVR